MKNLLLYSFFLLLFLPAKSQRIIVLGFDGMSGRGLQRANTPYIDSLKQTGAFTYKATAVIPTVSSPNWASMINGGAVRQHGIRNNDWERKDALKKTLCGQKKGEIFPTIFKVVKEAKPSKKVVCVHDWDGFARLANTESIDTVIDAAGEYETLRITCEQIKSKRPDFLFVHFDHVDHAGHEHGHFTEAYYKAITTADSMIGVIIKTLRQENLYHDAYIIITADHGGIRKGHGGLTQAEIEIPWVISGPGVKQNTRLTKRVKQYDTAATIAHIFNITPPDCWKGRAVKEAFKQP